MTHLLKGLIRVGCGIEDAGPIENGLATIRAIAPLVEVAVEAECRRGHETAEEAGGERRAATQRGYLAKGGHRSGPDTTGGAIETLEGHRGTRRNQASHVVFAEVGLNAHLKGPIELLQDVVLVEIKQYCPRVRVTYRDGLGSV